MVCCMFVFFNRNVKKNFIHENFRILLKQASHFFFFNFFQLGFSFVLKYT